jgi:hypothetical protein
MTAKVLPVAEVVAAATMVVRPRARAPPLMAAALVQGTAWH